ncbi:MAG: hypothetical protein OXI60_03095 [Acidiferrobacterales bacterium]|nr:hypothetical protein [Acidiferrobacterales bacterium]
MDPYRPVNPGKVEWSGDNPGIYLKQDPAGDWSSLGIYFSVNLSPHGTGETMIVLEQPDDPLGLPDANNICLTNNDELTHYLIRDYLSKFPSFKGRKGLDAMTFRLIEKAYTSGDLRDEWIETVVSGDDLEVTMVWSQLQEPFAAEVAAEASATGEHEMYSVFLEAKDAAISVNGKPFSGSVATRQFFGKEMSTAFMAISETWLIPAR